MRTLSYKPAYSFLEFIFGLIGPAIIVISIVFPLENMKIGTLHLDLPPGVANGILAGIGVLATLLTVNALLKKRAARSHGAQIVLDDSAMTFTRVRGYAGVPTTVAFADITKVVVSTGGENTVKLTAPSLRSVTFDADNMRSADDFLILVDTLKRSAEHATFRTKEVSAS